MGSDKRITDLAPLSDAGVNSLLNSLALEVDDPSLSATESRQILLSQLLSNRDIPDNTTTAYKAVTEAGLMKTNATYAKKGVVRLASTQDIDGSSGAVALSPDSLAYALKHNTGALLNITMANVGDHLSHTSPAFVAASFQLTFRRVGAIVHVGGYMQAVYSGTVSRLGMYFFRNGVPVPNIEQGVSCVIEKDGRFLSCGGLASGANPGYVAFIFDAPNGLNFDATQPFRFSFTYSAV